MKASRIGRRRRLSRKNRKDIWPVFEEYRAQLNEKGYKDMVVLSPWCINIRGRSHKLRIYYRTTEETRRWAINLLSGKKFDDLNGGQDDQKGFKSLRHGIEPQIKACGTFSDEI